ncbi:MAG: hypothetical protein QN175_06460 [Armatimonadota bacterium]|nr:hypothetical protein [Armatimonadota bacterium]
MRVLPAGYDITRAPALLDNVTERFGGMGDAVYVHARAEQCSFPTTVQGNRLVTYQGEQYVVLGFYFARSLDGFRDMYCILRLADGDLRAGKSDLLSLGLRRRRSLVASLNSDGAHKG